MGVGSISPEPRRLATALAAIALLAPAAARTQTCTWGGTPSLPLPTVAALRGDGRLLGAPARVAVDAEGRSYVTDPSSGRLVTRDIEGRLIRILDLGHPLGLAVDAFGVVYVGDERAGSVQMFDSGGHFLRALGRGDGEFVLPGHIAVDPGLGVVYVADSGADDVKAFRDGTLVARFGGTGSAAGQLSFPTGVYVSPAGEVFVADQNNDRVQVFGRDGTFLRCFGKTSGMSLTPRFGRAQGITGDAAGRIYVADAFQGVVKVFDAAGALLGTIGQFGERTGELRLPQSLAVDPLGRLLVASTGNARLEVFGLDAYSDPHVVDASVSLLRGAPVRRVPLWAAIEVGGHAATEIVTASLSANGVPTREARPRGDGRLWAAFDQPAVLATLPPEGGWVSVRGDLSDGSEFEATGWVGPLRLQKHPVPTAPTHVLPSRPGAASRGARP